LYDTLTRTGHPPPFLFITGQGTVDQAVRLIRSGAADYIAKPFDITEFLMRLARIMRPRAEDDMPAETGITAAARHVDRQAAEAALRGAPLLIRGAAGLGKVRLARWVHHLSDRRAAPCIVLDAVRRPATVPDLDRAMAEAADGTLVVAGIGHLDDAAQDRLIERLGGADFRLMATAGLSIDGPYAEHLRSDLRALLASHEIVVPSLAERPEDALWLADRLFPAFNARRAVPLAGLAASAEEAIRAHDWPDNGRELRARLMRAVAAAEGDHVLTSDLFPERARDAALRSLAEVRDAAERAQIISALERTAGQVGEAARLLRVSRTTLWEKMQKLGL
jgi:DNA-binding NtrC family response regulator